MVSKAMSSTDLMKMISDEIFFINKFKEIDFFLYLNKVRNLIIDISIYVKTED